MENTNNTQQMSENRKFLERLKSGDVNRVFESKQLEKLDKFAENMDSLANGKLDNSKPFSKILDLPKNERSEALDKAVNNLHDNLQSISKNLKENPGVYTKQQQAELNTLFDAMAKISKPNSIWHNSMDVVGSFLNKEYGLQRKTDFDRATKMPDSIGLSNEKDKYNQLAKEVGLPTTDEMKNRDAAMKNKNFDLDKDGVVGAREARLGVAMDANRDGAISKSEEKAIRGGLFGRSKEQTAEINQRLSDAGFGKAEGGGREIVGGNTFKEQDAMDKMKDSKQFFKLGANKGADKDVKPIISGAQAPNISAPTKGLNVGGR